MASSKTQIIPGFWSVLQAPAYSNVADWAAENRILGKFTAPEKQGLWNHGNAPYCRLPMSLIGTGKYKRIFLMWSAQTGKSEVLINALLYSIDCDPGTLMMVQPTQENCREWMRGRLREAMSSCESVRHKVPNPASRKPDQSASAIEVHFGGGVIYMAWSSSMSSLTSKPIRWVVLDEVDHYPSTATSGMSKTGGAPLQLVEERTQTFSDSLLLAAGTPLIQGQSALERGFLEGNQNRWFCSCLECEHEWCWSFGDIKFDSEKEAKKQQVLRASTAKLLCPGCGVLHDQEAVRDMSSAGRWIPTTEHPKRNDTASYHIWAIHSQSVTMSDIITKHLASIGDPHARQTFTNAVLAETWVEAEAAIDFDQVFSQTGKFTSDSLPKAIQLLTLTVDVQGDRVEYYVAGWSPNEQHFGIFAGKTTGDPTRPATWKPIFDLVRNRKYMTEDGRNLPVMGVGIDLGHQPDAVVKALYGLEAILKPRGGKAVGVRGANDPAHAVTGKRYTSKKRPHGSRQAMFPRSYWIGTNAIKDIIQLRQGRTAAQGGWTWSSEACFDDKYIRQFTSEKKEFKQGRDRKRRGVWSSGSRRNEALDLAVYAYAVLKLVEPDWQAIKYTLPKTPKPKPRQQARAPRGRQVVTRQRRGVKRMTASRYEQIQRARGRR